VSHRRAGWHWLKDSPSAQAVLAGLSSLALFASGLMLVFGGQDWQSGPPPIPPESVRIAAEPASSPDRSSTRHSGKGISRKATLPALPPARPVSLDIPAIGVHTSLMSLGLQPDGTIDVPPLKKNAPAGWYRYLSSPGEPGPAVILGHVDSARDGPAVFFRLGDLKPGDRFSIRRDDGWTTTFTVTKVGVYAKTAFPSEAVYGAVPDAQVRLVTCGGTFDRASGHYRDNIVVFARMTGARRQAED
jgi:sortase (surface protein transpeptidase)